MKKEVHHKAQKSSHLFWGIGTIGILTSFILAPKKLIGFSILENISLNNPSLPIIIFFLSLLALLAGFFKNRHAEELKKRHSLFGR